MARLILVGAALDPESNMGGQAFTLPLAIVWERALRRMFDDLAGQTGWRRLGDAHRTRRWDDPAGRNDPKRWLTADVLVQNAEARWVLDAKYKCGFGNEHRTDRFQMCAYATAFDAGHASLVYPTATGLVSPRILLLTTVCGRRLEIDSIALPMAAGPEICLAALTTIVRRTASKDLAKPLR